ncbi:MAG: hypothetical protein ACKVQW_04305 [Pyrinomonadaceae bacterium]
MYVSRERQLNYVLNNSPARRNADRMTTRPKAASAVFPRLARRIATPFTAW